MAVSAAERRFLLDQVYLLAQTDLNKLWLAAENMPDTTFFDYVMTGFPELANNYHQVSAQMAANWFEQSDPTSAYIAKIAKPLLTEQLASSAKWALGGDGTVGKDRLAGTLQRAAFNGARDTTALNVEATRSRWIRVARANACAFCRMLASRDEGYYKTHSVRKKINPATGKPYEDGRLTTVVVGDRSRTKRKKASEYHDHCYCTAVEIRSNQTVNDVLSEEDAALVQKWSDQYDKARANAGTGDTKQILSEWRKQDPTS